MGSGTKSPNYQDPTSILFGSGGVKVPLFGGGFQTIGGSSGMFDKDLYNQYLQQAKTGLTPEDKAMLENKSAGLMRSGEQGLRERFASMGGAPIGAQTGAFTGLRSEGQKNLLESLYQGNLASKQQGSSNIFNTLGLGLQGAGQANQFGLNKYQIDKENEFSWGDALGGLLGAGGQIGGAAIGKPKLSSAGKG